VGDREGGGWGRRQGITLVWLGWEVVCRLSEVVVGREGLVRRMAPGTETVVAEEAVRAVRAVARWGGSGDLIRGTRWDGSCAHAAHLMLARSK
jgi:hypothetical protein